MKKIYKLISIMLTVVFCLLTYTNVLAATFNIDFEPTTRSLLVANLDTDTTVYEKNPDEKLSIASLTKIMTYIVCVENIKDLDATKITIEKDLLDSLLGTGSSLSSLKQGDSFTVKQLLYCMMVSSGNDSALCLASYIGKGNINNFVRMMNDKANEIGCKNTHFVNPHGLYDPEHYSTASDLYKISKYALGLPYFSEITNTTTSYILGEDKPPLVTTNSMIDKARGGKYYYKYAKGIKTGHMDEAGYCLASTAIKGGYTYMCIALGAPSKDSKGEKITDNAAMLESKQIYTWAFNNLSIKPVVTLEQPIAEAKVKFAWDKDTTLLVPSKSFSTILPKGIDVSSIDISPNIPDYVPAPIKVGEKVGTATLTYANQKLATIDLVASENIERNNFVYITSTIKKIITSTWFIVIVCILLVLVASYMFLAMMHNRKIKAKKRNRYKKR